MPVSFQSPCFELRWEPPQGVFRLESPGRSLQGLVGVEVIRHGRAMTLTTDKLTIGRDFLNSLEDAHGQAEEISVSTQEVQGLVLGVRVRLYPSRPFVLLQISMTNVGPEPVHVRRFFFRTIPEGLQVTETPTGFFANGWQSWSHAGFLPAGGRGFNPLLPTKWLQGPMIQNAETPWPGKPGRFWSETVGAVVTPRETLVAGAASLADQFVQVYADLRPGHAALMLQSQADDIPLTAGEACSSEWFYLEWVPLPNSDPLAQFAYAVARQMNVPTLRPAPTGWCSWYIYWSAVAEADIMENMATAALLADEMPLEVIQLDEGFQSIWGDWTERNGRFPHDLSWLADRIRGSGFTPGLWLGPLTAHPKSRLASEHPDWLLRDHRGRPVSTGLISGFIARALDPSHPEVEDHIRDLIDTAVHKWGYSYLKLDFMYAGALAGRRYNPRLTRAQALRNIFRAIREAAGDDTYLVGCGAPFAPAIGFVDAMRVGPDTAPEWAPNFHGMHRFFRDNPSMPSLRNSLRVVATRAWIHNRWWTNDPDTLMVRDTQTQLTADEVLAQTTLLGLSGGLLILSDDLDALPLERRAMAAALLPPLLDGMDVLDLFQNEMPEEVVVPVARAWGRWQLVGLFNWSNAPIERTLPATLALNKRKAYHVVDFWERRYFRFEEGALPPVLHLPPHGAALLGIRPVRPDPHLVATTFHISQGAEITEWQAGASELSLTLEIGRLARGEVWLALPSRPKAVTLNDKPLPGGAVRALSSGVWAVACYLNRVGTLRVYLPESYMSTP